MKSIKELQIIVHGMEHEQYFQGCGTSFTKWTDVVTGCGYDFASSLNDALDMLVELDFGEEHNQILVCEYIKDYPEKFSGIAQMFNNKLEYIKEDLSEHDNYNSFHYYVSIRYIVN